MKWDMVSSEPKEKLIVDLSLFDDNEYLKEKFEMEQEDIQHNRYVIMIFECKI